MGAVIRVNRRGMAHVELDFLLRPFTMQACAVLDPQLFHGGLVVIDRFAPKQQLEGTVFCEVEPG